MMARVNLGKGALDCDEACRDLAPHCLNEGIVVPLVAGIAHPDGAGALVERPLAFDNVVGGADEAEFGAFELGQGFGCGFVVVGVVGAAESVGDDGHAPGAEAHAVITRCRRSRGCSR